MVCGECPAGKMPAIGATALDQVHLLVFLISCMHVAASIVVILLATARMRQWRRWQNQYLKELRAKEKEEETQQVALSSIVPKCFPLRCSCSGSLGLGVAFCQSLVG